MTAKSTGKGITEVGTKIKLFPAWVEIWALFWVVLAINHLTAFIAFADQFNALSLRFTAFEIIGVLSYVLAAALLESITVLVGLTLLSLILPYTMFRQKFAPLGALWYLMITVFLFPIFGFTSLRSLNQFFSPIIAIPEDQRVLFLGVWAVTIPALFFLFRRIIMRNSQKMAAFIDRLKILSVLYLVADCFAVINVFFRLVLP